MRFVLQKSHYIFPLPWLDKRFDAEKVLKDSRVRCTLRALVK
jgi:hypothetical protein